jgi:hypothetical protein
MTLVRRQPHLGRHPEVLFFRCQQCGQWRLILLVPLSLRRWLHRAWVSIIWVSPEGKLQPARGQAPLPSLKIARELMAKAKAQGWGNYDAEVIDASPRKDAAAYP